MTSHEIPLFAESDLDRTSCNVGEIMSALSKLNASTALKAAKAFAIATGLVAVGGMVLTWGAKEGMEVKDAREFGRQRRRLLCNSAPMLPLRIHRPPETDEEHRDIHSTALFGVHKEWIWLEAERRINRTYKGGLTICAQMARWGRAKREWEYEEAKRNA